MLSEEEVKHIAELARIALSDKEVKKFQNQLSDVLTYVEILKEVNTDDVAETSQVTGLTNILEKDEVRPGQSSREELLNCSELMKESKQVLVKRIIK